MIEFDISGFRISFCLLFGFVFCSLKKGIVVFYPRDVLILHFYLVKRGNVDDIEHACEMVGGFF